MNYYTIKAMCASVTIPDIQSPGLVIPPTSAEERLFARLRQAAEQQGLTVLEAIDLYASDDLPIYIGREIKAYLREEAE